MEDSENFKLENGLKENIDDSEKVEVDKVDFGEVIELSPESVTKKEESAAVDVFQAEEKDNVERSESSDVTIQEKEVESSSFVSDPEAPVEDLVSSGNEQKLDENHAFVGGVSAVTSDPVTKTLEEVALQISDANAEDTSGVAESVCKENFVDSSRPIAVFPGDSTIGIEDHDVSEIPSSTENQPSAVLNPQTPSSWMDCCGLLDVLRRSNQ